MGPANSKALDEDSGPGTDDAVVLSLLAVRAGQGWTVRAGSLLVLPEEAGAGPWQDWLDAQPTTRGPRRPSHDFRPSASFALEPFNAIRAVRQVVPRDEWSPTVASLMAGKIVLDGVTYVVNADQWSSRRFLPGSGFSEAHRVLHAACRPVEGIAANLEEIAVPAAENLWEVPDELLTSHGTSKWLANWPKTLLGVEWTGDAELEAPHSFVVGKARSDAWIADVVPIHESDQLRIVIAWDETAVDPIGCSLLIRSERDEMPFLVRLVRISEMPSHADGSTESPEARDRAWNERTLDVLLPRGPRRTDWGVALLAPDGRLLDERPVAPRVESIEISLQIKGATGPASTSTVGEKRGMPSTEEQDLAVAAARSLEDRARHAAAERRISTKGELAGYLRWRFSARAGELLIMDPYLLGSGKHQIPPSMEFIRELNREVRALTAKAPRGSASALAAEPNIEARRFPGGSGDLHDRVWLVGESGLLVGTSINSFLEKPGKTTRTTTVSDLPAADASLWRERFETWWQQGPAI